LLSSDSLRRHLPVLAAAVRNIIVFITVLSIPLAAAQSLGLSTEQTSSWILALYGVPALLGLGLTWRYQQPLLLTGNLFIMIFISGLGTQISYPELVGATILAGAAVLLVNVLGLSAWLATLVPLPIMFGLLAPVGVASTLVAYLLSRWLLGQRVPPIFTALLAGLATAALTGEFGQASEPLSLEIPQLVRPVFSLPAFLTASPVFVVLITIQANLPSLLFLRGEDYEPPEPMINTVSGIGTMLGSLLGPTGVSLSLPATSLVAGEGAGEHAIRHRSVYIVAAAALLTGLLAGIAAHLPDVIPLPLLLSLAGLALVDVLASALTRITQGSLVLGPLFAFAIALSDISLLGFGNYFWSLVIGTAVSLLLERQALRGEGDR
jgi:benzoate membrane transport protein